MHSPIHWQSVMVYTAFFLSAVINLVSLLDIMLFFQKASESQAVCNRHKRIFTILAITQSFIAIATGMVFATMSWTKGMDWPLYLAYSIILSSMIRECLWSSGCWSADQKPFMPWPFISITAVTGVLFILGSLLETRYTLFKHISAASAVAFRLWIVLEWVIVISGSSTSLTLLKMRLMLGVLAWMVTTTALVMESQLEKDLVLANTYATYDFLARATSLIDGLHTQSIFARLRSIFMFKWPYMGFRGRRASQASSEIQLGEFGFSQMG